MLVGVSDGTGVSVGQTVGVDVDATEFTIGCTPTGSSDGDAVGIDNSADN